MSLREAVAAIQADVTAPEKLLLVLLAEACGDDDDCHCRLPRVQRFSGMSTERFEHTMRELIRKGYLTPRGESQLFPGFSAFWFNTAALQAVEIPKHAPGDDRQGVIWPTT